MKTAVLLAVGAASVAVAKPHGHAHHHHKREPDVVTVTGPVTTSYAFVIGDKALSQAEACQGLADGSYRFDGETPDLACAQVSSVALPSPTSASSAAPSSSAESTSQAAAQFYQQSSEVEAKVAVPTTAATGSSDQGSGFVGTITKFVADLAQDSYPDFEDGVLSCSDGVPTKYGAMPVNYLNKNGWISAQILDGGGNVLGDGTSCSDGAICGYSCYPGYQSVQWPENQPSNGVSVGGIYCKGGKLYRSNSNSKLCGRGTGGVTVQNEASGHISVCRTNYPGVEDETVPVDVDAGNSQPLTCPDESTYYRHLGNPTSAQYYLNQIGVSAQEGCSWDGKGDGESGNSAPLNFGVGYSGGLKWLSIFQNAPTTSAIFRGTVNITGSGLGGSCSYEPTADGKDGKFCSLTGCQYVSSGTNAGCTVSASGDAVFVVSH